MTDRYNPPYHITDEMLVLVSKITEKASAIQQFQNLDARPQLRRNNRIRSIHSSLAIEANSLSLGQVKDVINGHRVLGPAMEIQEVQNAYQAYEKIPSINPFSLKDLMSVHEIMTHLLIRESGTFRQGEEGVFDGDRCIFMAPPARMVPQLMAELFQWMNEFEAKVHPLILSNVFHYEFVFIHPFRDGNGRVARLWQTALLYRWKELFQYVPLESQIQNFQSGYYDAIAKCNANGNSDIFIPFMLNRIDEILEEIVKESSGPVEQLTEYVKKLLSVMDSAETYSAAELMNKVGLRTMRSFRAHYLKPALEQGFISMTIPDKPTSRNQRYRKIIR